MKVLVIEDDLTVQDVLRSYLVHKGFEVTLATSGEQGLAELRADKFQLILTDLVMPGISGMEVLKEVISLKVNVPVIVVTAFGTVQTAVEAMRLGAFDYVTKPFNLDELMLVLDRALSVSQLQKENVMLRMQLKKKYNFKGIIGNSPIMQKVYELIEQIAGTDSTVLITGESGTGKELVAKTLHYNNSARAAGPFVPLNCAAIPRELLASELFGHEKGAFTGATSTHIGRFEQAQGGTIFLDEVGELDPSLQVKMLRVLQEREFNRVGGIKTIKVDVRIVAASNRDLEAAIRNGTFREDLYYRLNVIPLPLPPLRDRLEDIDLLIAHFSEDFFLKTKREPAGFSPETMDVLKKYLWPGNIRELENLVERVSILNPGKQVVVGDLPEKMIQAVSPGLERFARHPETEPVLDMKVGDEGVDLNQLLRRMERKLITQALKQTGGVRSKAAQLLSLNRTTLLEKMKKMGIEQQ